MLFPAGSSKVHWRLFLLSFVALFLELMLIRWSPAVVRLVAYYANLMLISSFLGLGVGAMLRQKQRLFAFFPALLLLEVLVLLLARWSLLPSTSGESRFYGGSDHWLSYLSLVAIFLTNAATFLPFGQGIGDAFGRLPPLRAYGWDLGGSLAGTLIFGLFSYIHFSPLFGIAFVMLLFVALSRLKVALLALPFFAAVLWIMLVLTSWEAIWSPYYYITMSPWSNSGESLPVSEPVPDLRTRRDPPIYSASVNHDFYQFHGTIDPSRYSGGANQAQAERLFKQYSLPYQIAEQHDRVLVLGAGGGMDVEAALLNGATHVDAAEIDPGLVALARRFSASGVYDDPRVTIHNDDARAFLRRAKPGYDLVIFGYLDSQALFSYMSNLRIDGYIYTVESIRNAWSLLNDQGVLSLSFAVSQQWLGVKLFKMVQVATGETPLIYVSGDQVSVIATRGAHRPPPQSYADKYVLLPPEQLPQMSVPLATDDWPYLYLSTRTVPQDYRIVIGTLLVLSVGSVIAIRGRRFRAHDGHFAFMGWGFLLLETSSISSCSLYFGTTWLVTMIVIAGVLLMVLAANALASRMAAFSYLLYAPLFASLLVLYLVPSAWVLSLPLAGRLAWALLVVPLPIFFAGLIFSSTFRNGADPAALLGANLIGAMIGGFCEYLGMAIGHHMLLIIVVGAYVGSLICLRTSRIDRGLESAKV